MFRLYDGGHNLSGTFTSPIAGVNDFGSPALYGTLQWNEHGFDVWNAGSKFYGGDAKFQYSIKPFGVPAPTTQRFDVHGGADRSRAVHGLRADAEGLRFAGAADGHVYLEWPSGKFRERRGGGHLVGDTAARRSADDPVARTASARPTPITPATSGGRSRRSRCRGICPIGGQMTSALDRRAVVGRGRRLIRSEKTYTRFDGAADWESRAAASTSTSSAATFRKPTSCSPASSPISDRRPAPCRSAAAASSTAR